MAIPPSIFRQEEPLRATLQYPCWQYADTNVHYAIGELCEAFRDDGKRIDLWWRCENTDPGPGPAADAMPGSYNPSTLLSVYLDELIPGHIYTFKLSSVDVILTAAEDCHAGEQFLKRNTWAYFRSPENKISKDQSELVAWVAAALKQ